MKKVFIVLGLGFGDEGKGLATDYLCSNYNRPIVIRFNGGHQAGHTVYHADNVKHTFSCFGSGTLRGVETYWSKYCTFSPAMTLTEYAEIKTLGMFPKLFVDAECSITTHYDILFNKLIEKSRDVNRHGSCGLGFGATVSRNKKTELRLLMQDIFSNENLLKKLRLIRLYYKKKICKLTSFDFSKFNHDSEDEKFLIYIEGVKSLIDKKILEVVSEKEIFSHDVWDTYIFEGAQGILLDMKFGTFPNITYSNTTSKNAINIIDRNLLSGIDKNILYVTRCYQTRHGAGIFNEENISLINNEKETNLNNEFQGNFRTGFLNIDLLNYSIKCDNTFSKEFNKHILITCIDHFADHTVIYYKEDKLNSTYFNKVPDLLDYSFDKTYYSFGPKADDIRTI